MNSQRWVLAIFCAMVLAHAVHAAAPEISSPLSATTPINVAFSYTITATNSPTSFNATGLPGTLSINTSNGVISGTPTVAVQVNITITATNGNGSDNQTLALTIYDPATGGAPVISSPTAFSMVVNTAAANVYQITATQSPTSFGATNLPTGLSVSAVTGIISAAAATAAVGQYTINVTATNAAGTGSIPVVAVINPSVGAPVISNLSPTSIASASPLPAITVSSGTPVSYNATGIPSGIVLSTSNGTFTGGNTGTEWDLATYFATDAAGRTGVATIAIQVFPVSSPPTVTSGGPPAGTVGQPYSYQMTASAPGTSFNCIGLLNGLSINSGTGLISGIPTAAGQFSVTFKAGLIGSRSTVGDGTKSATIIINPAAPAITSATTVNGAVGTALNYQIVASGNPSSFGATNLPPGLSVNGAGLISGTPTTAGMFTANVTASKAGLTGNLNVVFNIAAGAGPIITSALTASGAKGAPFSYQITSSGPGPVTFTATGLPAGLTLTTDTISGTPSVGGSISVTLTASNAAGTTTQILQLSITSGADDKAPVFSSPAMVDPNPGSTGAGITFTAAATDFDGDIVGFAWDFGDGLSGIGASVTHIYTAAGLYSVKVTISDGTLTDSRTVDVGVNDASAGSGTGTFTIKKAMIKFNLKPGGQDSLSLSGTVTLPSGFAPRGKVASVGIGGLRKDFVLSDKGKGGSPNNSFSLDFKKNPAAFTLTLKKQALFAALQSLGFTNATVAKPGASISAPVVLSIDGVSKVATLKVTYTATAKKNGTAK